MEATLRAEAARSRGRAAARGAEAREALSKHNACACTQTSTTRSHRRSGDDVTARRAHQRVHDLLEAHRRSAHLRGVGRRSLLSGARLGRVARPARPGPFAEQGETRSAHCAAPWSAARPTLLARRRGAQLRACTSSWRRPGVRRAPRWAPHIREHRRCASCATRTRTACASLRYARHALPCRHGHIPARGTAHDFRHPSGPRNTSRIRPPARYAVPERWRDAALARGTPLLGCADGACRGRRPGARPPPGTSARGQTAAAVPASVSPRPRGRSTPTGTRAPPVTDDGRWPHVRLAAALRRLPPRLVAATVDAPCWRASHRATPPRPTSLRGRGCRPLVPTRPLA